MFYIVIEKLKNTKQSIKTKFIELYKSKLKIENLIINKLQKKDIAYELITEDIEEIDIYIQEFLNQIWNSPKSLATILLNSKMDDFKNNLVHLIVHNFYDNISSLSHKDDQLIYIITLLLKEEINKYNDLNEPLIKDKKSDIIFVEFSKKIEVRCFFKRIFLEIVKKLKNTYSYLSIIFKPEEINKRYNTLFNINEQDNLKKYSEHVININKSNFDKNKDIEKYELIRERFVILPFNEYELNRKLDEFKDNKEMKEFIENIITIFKSSPEKFSNNIINQNQKIINYYINSFIQTIDIIDLIFDNLIEYSQLVPYSIRCIFKILLFLINKKFPHSKKIEQIRILSYFFFKKIFFFLIYDFPLNTFINEIEILNLTKYNIYMIKELLDNIFLGHLFTEENLTPFNWYLIEKMPKIFEFFNSICQVNLPSFLDKLINDNLPDNYIYDYFSENPEEKIFYRNICYNNNELKSLLINAEECKNNISINQKVLSKIGIIIENIENDEGNFKSLDKDNDKKTFVPVKKGIKYYLLSDTINNKKFDNFFSKYKNKYFSLKELKVIESNEEKIQNTINRVKNLFVAYLYNCEKLSKNNFKRENLENILAILKQSKNNILFKYSLNLDTNYISSSWYLDSIIQNLPRLPKTYIENDYKKLLNEMKNDLLNSLNENNFGELEKFNEYLKDLEKDNLLYIKIENIINDFKLNELAYVFIEKNTITFKTKSKDTSSIFLKQIVKYEKIFSKIFYKNKKEKYYYNSIEIFINNFPKLSDKKDYSFIEIMKKNKIKEVIDNYLILIKNELGNYTFETKKNLEEVYNKIYDYILERLYNKLFPKEKLKIDNNIFLNCKNHIWINYNNLIKEEKEYIFDNFLPESINYLKQFEIEKSPRKKLLCLFNLFNNIQDIFKYNENKLIAADDIFFLLEFIMIKAKPEMIYTNCKYVEFFYNNFKSGTKEDYCLTNMLAMCEEINNLSIKSLHHITISDYEENCRLASEGLFY